MATSTGQLSSQQSLAHGPSLYVLYISDRLGVTMHPAQPDWTFDEIVKV